MEEKRIKLYQSLKDDESYTKSYDEFINQFFNNSTNCEKLYNNSISEGSFTKTKKEWYQNFACDLEWAKSTSYCGGSTQQGGGQPDQTGGSTQQGGGQTPPATSFGTDTSITADQIKGGALVKYGMKGDIVGRIQERLKKHGKTNYSTSGNIDNIFGSKTKSMVKEFQREKGLKDDGVVGPLTWAELIKDPTIKPVTPINPVSPVSPVVPPKPKEPENPYTPTPADVKKTGGGPSRETINIEDID
jgi:hypothetical protein